MRLEVGFSPRAVHVCLRLPSLGLLRGCLFPHDNDGESLDLVLCCHPDGSDAELPAAARFNVGAALVPASGGP